MRDERELDLTSPGALRFREASCLRVAACVGCLGACGGTLRAECAHETTALARDVSTD